jgi:hypothetical protein
LFSSLVEIGTAESGLQVPADRVRQALPSEGVEAQEVPPDHRGEHAEPSDAT